MFKTSPTDTHTFQCASETYAAPTFPASQRHEFLDEGADDAVYRFLVKGGQPDPRNLHYLPLKLSRENGCCGIALASPCFHCYLG